MERIESRVGANVVWRPRELSHSCEESKPYRIVRAKMVL